MKINIKILLKTILNCRTYKNNIQALQEKRGWNLQIVTSRVNEFNKYILILNTDLMINYSNVTPQIL